MQIREVDSRDSEAEGIVREVSEDTISHSDAISAGMSLIEGDAQKKRRVKKFKSP